jgi:hypothetical protein
MDDLLPNEFYLSQNYPNPFKVKTSIKYCVPDKTQIKITIFDHAMTIIQVLENDVKEAGTHEVEFNAANLPSAVYFYRLQAGSFTETKKMLLIK